MATIKNDLAGLRFGRLLVLSLSGKTKSNTAIWSCLCDCGNTTDVNRVCLLRGSTKSCGCWRKEHSSTKARIHGQSNTRAYSIWTGMLSRCRNANAHGYERYGGRGISVCARWESFECFLEDMGSPPGGCTLDRIDNDEGYSKENCRWATREDQSNNTRSNRYLTAFGQTKTIAEWARAYGLKYQTLYRRLTKCKWPPEMALSKEVHAN